MLERELPILVKKSHFEDAWARDFCRQSLLDTKQQDAKSWLNIIKSRSYSLSRHTMISCYSCRVESDAMRDAFFPQKLQESRDYYLTFVILGKFRTFISHWLEKNNASLNWSLITKWAKRGKYFEILQPRTTKKTSITKTFWSFFMWLHKLVTVWKSDRFISASLASLAWKPARKFC